MDEAVARTLVTNVTELVGSLVAIHRRQMDVDPSAYDWMLREIIQVLAGDYAGDYMMEHPGEFGVTDDAATGLRGLLATLRAIEAELPAESDVSVVRLRADAAYESAMRMGERMLSAMNKAR